MAGFGISNAIIHIEFLLVGAGPDVYLVEFALRGCGSKVVTHLLPAITGVDVVRAVVRQALGLRTTLRAGRSWNGVLHFLMFAPGRITGMRGLDRARALPGVIDVTIERQINDRIDEVRDGRSRPGHLLVCGPTAEEVQQTIREVHALVRLEYDNGVTSAPLVVEAATR